MTEMIVSAKEVAEFLSITEGTVYRLAKEGKLPGAVLSPKTGVLITSNG